MKYRIMTNNYPYPTIIKDGFSSFIAALNYADSMADRWCFGHKMWHIESYIIKSERT